MMIHSMIETIETAAIEESVMECDSYTDGFAALRRTLPEGMRVLSVRVER